MRHSGGRWQQRVDSAFLVWIEARVRVEQHVAGVRMMLEQSQQGRGAQARDEGEAESDAGGEGER